MNVLTVKGDLADVSSFVGKTQKKADGGISFIEQLQSISETTGSSLVEAYQKYLERRYGNVMVQSVMNDQKSMDRIGGATFGTGNVVIAPNILEQMASNPEKAAYYEGKIQHYFQTLPACEAQLSAMGHEIHSSGVVIHPDGTVTYYVTGDLKPEVRAKIEAQIRAEDEAKAKRKREYQRLSEEAAERRRESIPLGHPVMHAPGGAGGLRPLGYADFCCGRL
ncbi:DUF6033 family protein [Sporofaciens musculi]|jgi:hypothetical protein|uniref:DUF6033 family protein n=1 Tax=Sporofaciens musculi TaxID=2681861 RepID=UPI002582CA03|nr:DUF6033 family protein [Sporofaciens musculi]